MKKTVQRMISLLPHITIALSLFWITCFIVDRYNRAMAFVNNDFTKITVAVLAILVILESVIFILRDRESKETKDAKTGKAKGKGDGDNVDH